MKQKSVGLTLRAAILALALILLVAGSPALPPFNGVAYAQSAVSTLTPSVLPNGNLQLDWTAVADADSYRLWKGDGSGTSVQWGSSAHVTLDAPTVTYVDSAVMVGQTYSYVVEAMDGDTRLSWSNVLNITIPGGTAKPTAKPAVTLAADGLSAITVSWTTVADAAHYQVRYWTVGLSGWMDIGGQEQGPTYSHTGLTSGTQYFYIVRAVNDGGDGPWSGTPGNYASLALEATTTVPVLSLDHPERLRVELEWTRVSTVAMYQVQRMKAVEPDADGDLSETWANLGAKTSDHTYTDTTVTFVADDDVADTIVTVVYHYRVQAEQDGEQGDYSNVKMATIPMSDALPTTPLALSATPISLSRINVSWAPVDGATSHQIQFKVGDGNYGSARTVTAPYLHTGLSAATEYTYEVRAVNVNGYSAWSAPDSATTLAATSTGDRVPTPTGLRAVDATTTGESPVPGIKVTWNPVSKASSYELRKWGGMEWVLLALTPDDQMKRSHTDTVEIAAGMTYYYIVAAIDDNDTPANTDDDDMGDWTKPESGTTVAVKPPAAPVELMATPRGESRVWVSWTALEGATEYVLQWRPTGSSTWRNITTEPGSITHAHTGRSPGTTYHYQVAGKNSGGTGPFADEESTTTWARALSTPTGVVAEDATDGENSRIKVTWSAVSGADGYELQRWSGTEWVTIQLDTNTDGEPDDPAVTTTSKTSYTDTASITGGITYYYIVRAVSGDVASDWSPNVSGMAKATMPALPVLYLNPTGQTRVRLTWTPAPDPTDGRLPFVYTGWELQYVKGSADANNFEDDRFGSMSITLPAMPRYETRRDLEEGTLYSYRIRGALPLGVTSVWSLVKQIITRPATPMLTATSVSSTSIELTWDVVNPPGFADADTPLDGEDYELQRRKTGETSWVTVPVSGGDCPISGKCSVTDEPVDEAALEGGKMYYYRLRVATMPTEPSDPAHPEIKSYWDGASARTPKE